MRKILTFAFAAALMPMSLGAADLEYRLSGFDASSLPRVYAVIDERAAHENKEATSAPAFTSSDFRLLEDGKATDAALHDVKFRDAGMGVALVVAIDVSRSMEGRPLNAIRQGLAQLVTRKRSNDRVTVLSFANDIRWETRWDATPDTVKQAIGKLQTRGNATRLHDAVGAAMDEIALEARQDSGFPARTCILVLSDGHDEGSRFSLGQIVNRLRSSRVRLDAVGLVRQPLWLRNLQALSHAGFGGFRTAAAPEDLTRALGEGIDALLDLPALEFKAKRISADGKLHEFGIEHLPTRWRATLPMEVPGSAVPGDWRIWSAVVAVVLLIAGFLGFRRLRPQPPAAPRAMAASVAPSSPPAPTYARAETVAEASPKRSPITIPPTIAENPRPVLSSVNAAPPSPRSQRPTILAPQNGSEAAPRSLAVAAGPYAGQRFAISSDEFWIGSSANNHLCLSADSSISGNHACIRREDTFLRLYDNASLNNTFVNGRAIGQEVVLLRAGDRIRLGQTELSLER